MKNIIMLLGISLLLSCEFIKDKFGHGDLDIFLIEDTIVKRELATGNRYDTIFLGFRFGMSEKEVTRKFSKLVKAGDIYIKDKHYTYDFVFSEYMKCNCTFSTEYHNDILYSLTLRCKDGYLADNSNVNSIALWSIYSEKYGHNTLERDSFVIDGSKDFIWINGNRKIVIMPIYGTVIISYEDLSMVRKIRKETKEINNYKKTKTLDDI